VNQIGPLRESKQYNGVPIIAIGKDDVCRDLEVHNMNSPDLVIRRPISPDNLSLRITRLLDELKAGANETPELKAPKVMIGQKVKSDVKKQILIVDDDRTVLTMLKKALSDEYDVTTMVNSMLLEKCIDTKKVDLIILDYEMPNETGADVFRRLKANEKSKDIPVCFLTGVADRNKIMEIMQLKPHGYLLKPIDIEMLKSTIGTLME
jgi:DNA-binding response OmpR family regulator